MITVTINIKRYDISFQTLVDLAAEYYGKVLQGNDSTATLEFGFDGEHEVHAITFQKALNTTFKRPPRRRRTQTQPPTVTPDDLSPR